MATIHHQVWINAPVATVYEAIATVDGIGTWWDKQTPTQTERGLVLEHDPGPEHGVVKLHVVELAPHRRVEWECISTHPAHTPAAAWTGTRFVFEITERKRFRPALAAWAAAMPVQAILDFRHAGWSENSDYFGFCSFAWGGVLQKLQQVCEAGQQRA